MNNTPDNVRLSSDIQADLKDFLASRSYTKSAVLVDENTLTHCYPLVKDVLPPSHILIQIKSGEQQKHLQTCTAIWQKLTDEAFDRKSLLINLGGGVIGDMGGFCAATFKRGIDFINIPTTLLAQVDASVGGKLGIDFNGFKNHIGVFQIPEKVLISSVFLKTLDPRELRSGFAEIIKHCLIRDKKKYEEIRGKELYEQDWDDLIAHSVQIKNEVVSEDPTEKGLRKILNFGHTIGHAIETRYLDEENFFLHGEAIAIGMICEAYLSHKKMDVDEKELNNIFGYLVKVYQPPLLNEGFIPDILNYSRQDKKNKGDEIRASLLRVLGDCAWDIGISMEEIESSIKYYNANVSRFA